MKRLVSIAAAISTVLLGTAVSAQTYISGGGIEIGGNVNTAREGDIVTISVLKTERNGKAKNFGQEKTVIKLFIAKRAS